MYQGWHKLIEERLFLIQEGISITHSTAENTTNHITSLRIRWQLSICNRERHSTKVVSTDTHSHIDVILLFCDGSLLLFLKGYIFQSCQLLLSLYDWLEHICIIVRVLTLQHTDEAFKTHTRIDDVHGEFLETSISLTVKLHKHEVPYFNYLGIILVHQLATTLARGFALLRRTRIDMYLRTRSTRTCIAHLPEVIVFVTINNMVLGHMLSPIFRSFIISGDVLLG